MMPEKPSLVIRKTSNGYIVSPNGWSHNTHSHKDLKVFNLLSDLSNYIKSYYSEVTDPPIKKKAKAKNKE